MYLYIEIKYDGDPEGFREDVATVYLLLFSFARNLCYEIEVVDGTSTVNVTCDIITRNASFQ